MKTTSIVAEQKQNAKNLPNKHIESFAIDITSCKHPSFGGKKHAFFNSNS